MKLPFWNPWVPICFQPLWLGDSGSTSIPGGRKKRADARFPWSFNFTFNKHPCSLFFPGDTGERKRRLNRPNPNKRKKQMQWRYLARLWQWPMVCRKRPMANSQWFLENGPPSKHGSVAGKKKTKKCQAFQAMENRAAAGLISPRWQPPWSSKMLPTKMGNCLEVIVLV